MKYDGWEEVAYRNAIAASGAVQAARWSGTPGLPKSKHAAHSDALGYIYSFNGPHSLFIDTMRTTRILGVAWQLGHSLMHEGDRSANLLKRSVLHGLTTSHYIVFHGDSEHTYDVARTHRPRRHVQPQQRRVPRPLHPAGLQPVLPLGRAACRGPCAATPRNSSSSRPSPPMNSRPRRA